MTAPLDPGLPWPRRPGWRVGCVGTGFVMRDCHLPAYRQHGLTPVAIAGRSSAAAATLAVAFGIPTAHPTVEALLADPQVEVLDLAVPPEVQPDLIRRAVDVGRGRLRGVLAQKPLALSVADGRDLVGRCAAAGVALAVNQNMRFDPSVRAAKALLARGDLGDPVFASLDMRAVPHWMPWAERLPGLSTFVMSVHHLDCFRFWLGEPTRVLASTRPDPRTRFPHRDGVNLYILEFASGARASAWDDVWAGPVREGAADATHVRWRLEGTDGLAEGEVGWPRYPARTPSTIAYTTRASGGWVRPAADAVWFPDAFAGPLGELLCALEEGREPAVSGRDNLGTLALCEAVYAAATGAGVVDLPPMEPGT